MNIKGILNANPSFLVFVVTFGIGAILFIIFWIFPALTIGLLGISYLVIAIFINIIIAGWLFLRMKQGVLLLFLNIPIAIGMLYGAHYRLSHIHLTLTNASGFDIESAVIKAVRYELTTQIDNNQTKVLWIPINGDGGIQLEYQQEGIEHIELVFDYLTDYMGGDYEYIVGADSMPIDSNF